MRILDDLAAHNGTVLVADKFSDLGRLGAGESFGRGFLFHIFRFNWLKLRSLFTAARRDRLHPTNPAGGNPACFPPRTNSLQFIALLH